MPEAIISKQKWWIELSSFKKKNQSWFLNMIPLNILIRFHTVENARELKQKMK